MELISIHALREEGDSRAARTDGILHDFYPRPPRGGRHELDCNQLNTKEFLSTPSARRATTASTQSRKFWQISIHALREEGDFFGVLKDFCDVDFYPRPPRGGRRPRLHEPRRVGCISIHALREEGDDPVADSNILRIDFYPRPPRGGRPERRRRDHRHQPISIHALREEGDEGKGGVLARRRFLSTPSARRATRQAFQVQKYYEISIHALREEGDDKSKNLWYNANNFYPRPPRGGRRGRQQAQGVTKVFLSTPSARRATLYNPIGALPVIDFYPRPPRGGRRSTAKEAAFGRAFLSTPSARRATLLLFISANSCLYFYPRPPRGGRRTAWMEQSDAEIFLSTPSARRATFCASLCIDFLVQFLSTPSARRATGQS